jgi:hypothetical protein
MIRSVVLTNNSIHATLLSKLYYMDGFMFFKASLLLTTIWIANELVAKISINDYQSSSWLILLGAISTTMYDKVK